MNNYTCPMLSGGDSTVATRWHRMRVTPHWLISISITPDHGAESGGNEQASYPGARAVIDDYGTLVCVTGWR